MEDITDADSTHKKRVCKDFKMTHLGEYRDLYVQSNTLLLADIFENFRNMCLETYEFDPVRFLTPIINCRKRCQRRNMLIIKT